MFHRSSKTHPNRVGLGQVPIGRVNIAIPNYNKWSKGQIFSHILAHLFDFFFIEGKTTPKKKKFHDTQCMQMQFPMHKNVLEKVGRIWFRKEHKTSKVRDFFLHANKSNLQYYMQMIIYTKMNIWIQTYHNSRNL